MKDIWDCALGFMDSQILLTAEEIGIFRILDENPSEVNEIAEKTRLPVNSAQRLMNALCALGFINRKNNHYENSEQTSLMLVPGKPEYIGHLFLHTRTELYPLWGHLKEVLYSGKSRKELYIPKEATTYSSKERVATFIRGMHAITFATGTDFAEQAYELEKVKTIVDIGGAGGSFLLACLQKHPHLKGVVYDLPLVEDIAKEYFKMYNVNGSLTFTGADFFKDPVPHGADAYVLGFILHDWNEQAGSVVLSKIKDASKPGSLLIIGEYLLNETKTGPMHVVRADLNMLVSAEGQERTLEEYSELIEKHGFSVQRVVMTRYLRAYIIAARIHH